MHRAAQVHLFQLDFSGFDLGEVEDAVDHAQQRVGRKLHSLQIVPLFACQLGFERKIRHTDDAVQGRANLVAHIRQELAFRTAAFLRRRLASSFSRSSFFRLVTSWTNAVNRLFSP